MTANPFNPAFHDNHRKQPLLSPNIGTPTPSPQTSHRKVTRW